MDWSADQVRKAFVHHCTSISYTQWPSSPAVLVDDPTPLFADAEVNKFKVSGTAHPDSQLVSQRGLFYTQKRIHVGANNDLVGKDTQTLLEFLGSLVFGYDGNLKKDAIENAWILLTKVYSLSTDKLYVTYFEDPENTCFVSDNESKNLWLEYLPPERVLPFGSKENFWKMGDIGLCGPCTQIHYDLVGGRDAASLVNSDDATCIKICDLVFIQLKKEADHKFESLQGQHVGTEMAFECLTSILQHKTNIYDTDIFMPLFNVIHKLPKMEIEAYSGKVGSNDVGQVDMAYRVIAEHTRTLSFAISDGSLSGNKNLVRRILRQAVYFGRKKLMAKQDFFSNLMDDLVLVMGDVFPELRTNEKEIKDMIKYEEADLENILAKIDGTFFCTRCCMLMRNTNDIVKHHQLTQHRRFLVSTSDEQSLHCMGCQATFSSLTESDYHFHDGDDKAIITIFCDDLPKHDHAGFLTPPIGPRELTEIDVVQKAMTKRRNKQLQSPVLFASLDDATGSSDEEIELDEHGEDLELPLDDSDEEDDEEDGKEDDKEDGKEDGKEGRVFESHIHKNLLLKYSGDSDSSDEPSIQVPGHARTLKNLYHNSETRKYLRGKYIIAEAVSDETALKRVNLALEFYEKHHCFSRPARKISYEPLLGNVCLAKLDGFHIYGDAIGLRMYKVLEAVKDLLLQKRAMRENTLHYTYSKFSEPELKPEQLGNRIRKAVTEITLMLQISRESLRLRPSPKGLIRGAVKCYVKEKLLCDGTLGGASGSGIPSESDLITHIETTGEVKYVLVLEKDTVFQYLNDLGFFESEACILVCGKGQPDVATRVLVRKLKDQLPKETHFYAMVDCNPSGAIIYSTYCFGSEERSHDNIFLTAPDLKFLGLSPSDVDKERLTSLDEADIKKADKILANQYLPDTEETRRLKSNLAMMKEMGKADLDILIRGDKLVELIKDKIKKSEQT